MSLNQILIKDCKVSKVGQHQSKVDIVVYPLDSNNDLEPGAALKVYINDNLVKNLMSNEFGEASDSFIINSNLEEVKIQVKDISENIKSKVKIVLQSADKSSTQGIFYNNSSNFSKEKQEIIAKLKLNPWAISGLTIEQKNDIDIVIYAIKQAGNLLAYAGDDVRNNKEIAKIVVKQSTSYYCYLGELLRTDEDFILELLKEYGPNLSVGNYVENSSKISNWLHQFREENSILSETYHEWLHRLQSKVIESLESKINSAKYRIDCIYNVLNQKSSLIDLGYRLRSLNSESNHIMSLVKNYDPYGTSIGNFFRGISEKQYQEYQNKLSTISSEVTSIRNTLLKELNSWFVSSICPEAGNTCLQGNLDEIFNKLELEESKCIYNINSWTKELIVLKKQVKLEEKNLIALYKDVKKKYPFIKYDDLEKLL